MEKNIKWLKFILPLLFLLFLVLIFYTINTNRNRIESINNSFSLKFSGLLIEKKSGEHNGAMCKIFIHKSNFTSYRGRHVFGSMVELNNNIVSMRLIYDHCLQIGDSVFVGPGNNFMIKRLNDTLYIHKQGLDKCYHNDSSCPDFLKNGASY